MKANPKSQKNLAANVAIIIEKDEGIRSPAERTMPGVVVDKTPMCSHLADMSQTLQMTPGWDAVGWLVTHNTRDLIDHRYGLLPEVVSWLKSLAMFRETERELMILKEPGPDDRNFHKTLLALLIAEGERLRSALERSGTLPANESSITRMDVEAALEHLYDTQAVWHGEMTAERKAEILQGVFHHTSSSGRDCRG